MRRDSRYSNSFNKSLQISPTRCTILLNIFIYLSYMFRASMCPSSGENCCIYATLVIVTLYGWRPVRRPDLYLLSPWSRVLLENLTDFSYSRNSRLYGTRKIHYLTHKCPPPVPILNQLDPVHIPTLYLLKIHLNIILPSTPGSPNWSLSLRFPPKPCIRLSSRPYVLQT